MLERPGAFSHSQAEQPKPIEKTLVLTKEMAVQPDLLPLQEQVAHLQSQIAAGQFESSAVTEYADDIERISQAINGLRETDPIVRQKQLLRYENALKRIGEVLATTEAEPVLTTPKEQINKPESDDVPTTIEGDVVDSAKYERLVTEVSEEVRPLFALATERLRRDGTPEHVEALKLISTLRLRYYQLDQVEQALRLARGNSAELLRLRERFDRTREAVLALSDKLQSLPIMSQEEVGVVAVSSEPVVAVVESDRETGAETVISREVVPTTVIVSNGELAAAETEPIIEAARKLAFREAESSNGEVRRVAGALLGAIQLYEKTGNEHTLRDIEKRVETLDAMTAPVESVEQVSIPQYVKEKWQRNKQFLAALVFAVFPQSASNQAVPVHEMPQAQYQNYFSPAWSSEMKESQVKEQVMINDGVLPQIETSPVEDEVSGADYMVQSAEDNLLPPTLEVSEAEIGESDIVFKETGIRIEEPKQVETPAAFFGKEATYIPADPNIVLEEKRDSVTIPVPMTASPEPLTEKVVTNESIPAEKIKFVIGEGPDYYIENYWPRLVDERSSDIPESVHDKLVQQVLAELYSSIEMQRSLGIREGKNPNQIYVGDEIDYTVMLNRLRELESFTRMGVSEPPAPLGVAEDYEISASTEEVKNVPSESISSAEVSAEAPAFDEARYQSWLSENFNIDLKERWFSSMFSSGLDNKSLLSMTIGEATELSLMSPDELATELVVRKIDGNVFKKLNGLIVSARRAGELPSEVKNDRLVSDFLTEQFTRLTA